MAEIQIWNSSFLPPEIQIDPAKWIIDLAENESKFASWCLLCWAELLTKYIWSSWPDPRLPGGEDRTGRWRCSRCKIPGVWGLRSCPSYLLWTFHTETKNYIKIFPSCEECRLSGEPAMEVRCRHNLIKRVSKNTGERKMMFYCNEIIGSEQVQSWIKSF